MAPRIEGIEPRPTPQPEPSRYQPGPDASAVRSGGATIGFGDSGASVRDIQRLLNAAGARPPLAEDGLFGPKTQAALLAFQGGNGLVPSGRVDSVGLAALGAARPSPSEGDALTITRGPAARAPRIDEPAPAGSVPSRVLVQADEAQRRERSRDVPAQPLNPPANPAPGAPTPSPAPIANPAAPAVGQSRADAELQAVQSRTIASAQRELAAGVREDHSLGDNRSPRIDQYARDAGMPPGGQWCGYFTGFNYAEAARESGGRFRENIRFHSMQKARSYFEYRNYTNNSPTENRRLDALRTQQEAEGSTRRWMVLSGSGGERHARENQRPYETFEPNNLPIREGDTALFSRGHVGLVESYDPTSGRLVTIEGNSIGEAVRRRTYNLNDPRDRAAFEGFGRPARGDFDLPAA
ncbi:MAG: peptidoglycan-binding domain-containing protein [Myxococcota bacterium]